MPSNIFFKQLLQILFILLVLKIIGHDGAN